MGVGLNEPNEEECRAELAAVLASDALRRSPKLSRLLTYLCDKQLSGLAREITEYSIAHDALGRSAEFDPQQDAVVRVDIHHLRKRLKDFYAGPGAGHAIQIVIPTGQYAPQFVPQGEAPAAVPEALLPEPVEPPVQPATSKPATWKWWIALAAVLLVAALAAPHFTTFLGRGAAVPASVPPAAGAAESDEIRIAAGDRTAPYTDSAGRTWLADRYFTGGLAFHRPNVPILRTRDPELFQNGREGQFVYAVPLRPGIYELHLYFAETAVASDTLRSVTLAINGEPATSVDVASDAGGTNTATMKVFEDISPAQDGYLHLMFQGTEPRSFLNAIEILPSTRGKMLPIRITTADNPFRDHSGQLWLPDRWGAGGRKSTRVVPIAGTSDAALYHWERVGHFNYSIPVPNHGLYTVILHFSETWFTPPNASGGIGSRVFDVYCNGTTLLQGFDILKDAGGKANQSVIRTFRHVHPSPLGKIELSFVPVVNYALINAIEVVQE